MLINALLSHWRADPETGPNFAASQSLPPRPSDLRPFPVDLPPALTRSLSARGITALYSHQVEAWEAARRGENVVLATGTASGKTLGYNLPVLAALLENAAARALYLFPTKALAQDQLSGIQSLQSSIQNLQAAIYDGDTPQSNRSTIRKSARILLSNPDMLHTGILPHHTNWEEFFRNLRFVIIDEMHTYRGVFGSHVANVLRRLKRVAAFYGAHPQFILTSATISNPADLAERLIEDPVHLVDRDGSARGPRHFVIYNPPVVDKSLGLRKSATQESVRLAQELLSADVQTVVFARSRRSVEILLTYLQSEKKEGRNKKEPETSYFTPPASISIRGYRSGYLPSQRREIEKGLRDGSVRMVVATNALELGIDIGGLDAALLVGYPGTVASARQQAGRAGRGLEPALAILVATPSPLDQFLARHPEFLFERTPEQALLDPDHLLILLNHLRCAMFELPFQKGDAFGNLPADRVDEFLQFLGNSGEVHESKEKYYWMADAYPAASVSLRSASPETVVLHAVDENGPHTIGQVDMDSALWMVHPRAVYLHEGQQFYVQELDLEKASATLVPVALDYFTEPQRETSVEVLTTNDQMDVAGGGKSWGELQVTTRVVSFRKRSWTGGENLGQEPLDLPPRDLQTTGYWLSISKETVEILSRDGLWTNSPNDYGPHWTKIRLRVRTRDGFNCQMCGRPENGREHDVHHRAPFRTFRDETGRIDRDRANQLDNLITLCPECHRKAETNVRVRSGLAGLGFVLSQLAPLFLMCDPGDLGQHMEPVSSSVFAQPSVVLYDMVPAGIGFSQRLFEMHADLMQRALELVSNCPCEDGCPSCVGPGGENGMGGKLETMAILKELTKKNR